MLIIRPIWLLNYLEFEVYGKSKAGIWEQLCLASCAALEWLDLQEEQATRGARGWSVSDIVAPRKMSPNF